MVAQMMVLMESLSEVPHSAVHCVVSVFLVYRSPAVGIYNLVSRSSSYETPLKHIIAPDRRLKVSRIEIHFSLRFA